MNYLTQIPFEWLAEKLGHSSSGLWKHALGEWSQKPRLVPAKSDRWVQKAHLWSYYAVVYAGIAFLGVVLVKVVSLIKGG